MRIYDRSAVGAFVVTDRASGDSWRVDPDSFLTPRQSDKMIVRPDLILQFAHHLADIWAETGREVSVHAEICKFLNGRPCQTFIDPEVDLAGVQRSLLAADPWVLSLETPRWGVADNRRPVVIAAVGDGVMARGPN